MATKTKTYRLPEDLLARMEAYRQRMQESSGIELKETSVVVALLRRGLDSAEAEAKRRK